MSEHSVLSAYLLTHNDEAGARHTEHAKGELSALGVRVYIVNLPGLHDLNELLVQDGPEALCRILNGLIEAMTLEPVSDLS